MDLQPEAARSGPLTEQLPVPKTRIAGVPPVAAAAVETHLHHGLVDYPAMLGMLQAISTVATVPVVRVPWLEPGILMKTFDAGAAQAVDHVLARAKAHGVVAGIHNGTARGGAHAHRQGLPVRHRQFRRPADGRRRAAGPLPQARRPGACGRRQPLIVLAQHKEAS
jgi:hypothetical protein